ncbi:hypothetical protein, partial [Klebsiella pneumoniae]|uniref:hypothetical protein n=1 Tax=Klebsiella pneumoniae TaxID=573 RepID=UPI003CF6DA61
TYTRIRLHAWGAERITESKNPAQVSQSGIFKFGSSDWTRTSSTSPFITAFVKYSHIFTNIFTIIIVFLW